MGAKTEYTGTRPVTQGTKASYVQHKGQLCRAQNPFCRAQRPVMWAQRPAVSHKDIT